MFGLKNGKKIITKNMFSINFSQIFELDSPFGCGFANRLKFVNLGDMWGKLLVKIVDNEYNKNKFNHIKYVKKALHRG